MSFIIDELLVCITPQFLILGCCPSIFKVVVSSPRLLVATYVFMFMFIVILEILYQCLIFPAFINISDS